MLLRLFAICCVLSCMPFYSHAADLSLLEYKAMAEKSYATVEASMTLAHYYAQRYNQGGEGQEFHRKAANIYLNKAEKAKKIYAFCSEQYNRKLRILKNYTQQ